MVGAQVRDNFFNLDISADFMVIAGGAKHTINFENSDCLFNKDGKPKFSTILEASDEYITVNAQENLFKRNLMVFSNTTITKGQVIFTSMEVMAN